MTAAAHKQLGDRISGGVVITKYDHARGPIGPLTIWEAGHPVPDENSYRATQAAIEAVSGLRENEMVLFLLSGGGSALFDTEGPVAKYAHEKTTSTIPKGLG